ncbi:hypothetical protein [Ramlibacter humi]|uniref:Uncharacterized protein n=1 Tax=Ramlibacter humi TaxID=2530451 RepID=A0A4Z0BZK1_9BURK|nr:hypothetical protein [Ramlibacter humi]TFZ03964.1 hypothetical protein EZ216_10015 [Ramlibacter humi]
MNLRLLTALVLAAFGLAAQAKLPPPDDAAKAKAAEATAKAAWQAKVDAFQLCKAQDKVVARYKAGGGKNGKAAPAAAAAAKPASSPVAAASSPVAAASAPAAGASAPGTPVAYAPPTPCADPGPFAYNPPEQKPLETSGAHSPPGTAASPPSVRNESATMTPAKPSTAPAEGAKKP